ncbi:type II toxin-antitoxin system VapC family toxin [Chelatococcus asaccharovorans]|uniref:type II toxin-antitoxin system VapC family toxin n=1 Tax=Chelatococcus asaccharovorans TaxID=28210 RepID=UPI00224C6F2E|nr:type II toxin-antitoxin system VapC family toxin [Chelatococcus asaccharovorans]CAH1658372.1 Ribonuclease VapC [Chelatococcus asaccharovorans]CAH1688687.1 Ribonuclease VapC [Chelatococcus asaccharovorans]
MQQAQTRLTSPLAVWEATIAVARVVDLPIADAAEAIESYLALMDITMVNVPPETARIALDAFDRYGKDRHPARLNFGDCFAYACARHHGVLLIFEGSDFARTDIEAA